MARPVKFTPTKTRGMWVLNIPAKFSTEGKRTRWYFKTKSLAEEAAEPLRDRRDAHGTAWKSMPLALAAEVTNAQSLLEPMGLSLVEAAKELAKAREILAPWNLSLNAVATKAAEEAKATAASCALAAAWDAFDTAKKGRAEGTKKGYRQLRQSMVAHFGEDVRLAVIKGQGLVEFLDATTKGEGVHRNARLRYLRAFWGWCAKPPRQWCLPETTAMLELAEPPKREISVLTVEQAKKLFATCERETPALIPWLGLSLFAGCRQAEIKRMKPADITSEGVTVANSNKTGRRHIAMSVPLAAWLKAYPILPDAPEVLPADFDAQKDKLRRLAGWRVEAAGMPKPSTNLPVWPQNVLRHTAASLAVGLGKPIDILIFEHGHSDGVNTLKKHYLGLMPRSIAEAIWRMGPGGTELPLLNELAQAAANSKAI